MARLVTQKRQVLTRSLHTAPVIEELFWRNIFEWMARSLGTYNAEIVREFYISYVATVRNSIYKWPSPQLSRNFKPHYCRTLILVIKKATLSFTAKFFWLLVQNRLSPTQVDNVVTWDRTVMIAVILSHLEVDFACILIAEIHERVFKATTTLPFPYLIFQLCRDASVPILHCDRLLVVTKNLDIGLIWDDANLAALRREPHVTLPPLGDDLATNIEQM
uniref:Putative plant transposon protein domain-containing protein n=1 Tax=Solanum tuberosum TaxID=4113 RepID=M1DV82_SOLTU